MALNVVWYAEFYVGRWTRAVCQHHLQKRAVISSPSTRARVDYVRRKSRPVFLSFKSAPPIRRRRGLSRQSGAGITH
ncbi:MAG: hypothetical protein FWF18_06215 [Dehalococcoidia bacterium]|nr:hypothetical protein [Dehalococcoidia bacterium]